MGAWLRESPLAEQVLTHAHRKLRPRSELAPSRPSVVGDLAAKSANADGVDRDGANSPAPSPEPSVTASRAKLVSDLVWAGFGRCGFALFGFAVVALIARLMPPEQVGTYFLLLSIVLMVGPLANLSLPEPTVAAIAAARGANDRPRAAAVARSTLRLGGLGGASVAMIWLAIWAFFPKLRLFGGLGSSYAIWLALWIAVYALESLAVGILQGLERISLTTVFGGVLGRLLSLTTLGLLWLWYRHAALNLVLPIVIGSELLSVLLAVSYVSTELDDLGNPGPRLSNAELWSNSWPFLVDHLAGTMAAQSDVIILGLFRPTRQVALYGTSLRLSLFLGLAGAAVNVPIAPLIARLQAQGKRDELQNLLQAASAGVTVVGFCLAVVYIAAGASVLRILFGSFYQEGAPILAILSVGHCTNLALGPCLLALAMSNEQRILARIAVATSVIKTLLMVAAAGPFGAVGVAVASAIGNALLKIASWMVARSRLGINTRARFGLLGKAWKEVHGALG
jgi:O-antigen/teichoic acid export membrane protein